MMERTEQETGWFYDVAEWISYNPRTVAVMLIPFALVGCVFALRVLLAILGL